VKKRSAENGKPHQRNKESKKKSESIKGIRETCILID
jgi:hypothetical protein